LTPLPNTDRKGARPFAFILRLPIETVSLGVGAANARKHEFAPLAALTGPDRRPTLHGDEPARPMTELRETAGSNC